METSGIEKKSYKIEFNGLLLRPCVPHEYNNAKQREEKRKNGGKRTREKER